MVFVRFCKINYMGFALKDFTEGLKLLKENM